MVGHNYERQKKLLSILTRPSDSERRNDKELKLLEPLLSELKFFRKTRKMDLNERLEVCRNLQYEYRNPGETVFK